LRLGDFAHTIVPGVLVDTQTNSIIVLILTAVAVPVFAYFQAQLKELKGDRDKNTKKIDDLQKEVEACHKERMADRIWRAKWESTIESIVNLAEEGCPAGCDKDSRCCNILEMIRIRVKADRAKRKEQERREQT